jgi:two-component system phosphate regulon sensor histidine kinase PhoR
MVRHMWANGALICGLLAAPPVAVCALAAGVGTLGLGWAAVAAPASMLAVWLVLRHPLHDARELVDYVRRLASRGQPLIPPMRTAMGRELVTAIARLHETMNEEARQHAALAASHGATLDSLPDPLLLIDSAHRVVGANLAAQALLERDPEGADLASVLRVPAVLDAAEQALAGIPVEDVEFSRPSGGDGVFAARFKRLSEPGPGGARLVLSLHDMTAARRADRMRAEFVANASHELRTPLASLQGFIETLAGPAKDDAAAREQFLPIMLQTATRMARLIDDLLSLSRIEFDEHTQPKEAVDLAAVVLAVVDGLVPQAAARSMSLDLNAPAGLPPVRGQADQLAQVLQNLLDNAIKYGRDGTAVAITLAALDGKVAVSVHDQGAGIAREHLPRLTERFFRCDAARSRELGGTGLGLAIVKHIVNRHRGQLLIDSQLGRGSTFTVHLPVFAG